MVPKMPGNAEKTGNAGKMPEFDVYQEKYPLTYYPLLGLHPALHTVASINPAPANAPTITPRQNGFSNTIQQPTNTPPIIAPPIDANTATSPTV